MKALMRLLVGFGFVGCALASEEDHAVWSSIEIVTADIPRAGKVSVSARVDPAGISKLTIVAFGRAHEVAREELKKLSQFPLAGMTVTHEAGYEISGGYSVHIRFRRSYYDSEHKLRDETAIVSV